MARFLLSTIESGPGIGGASSERLKLLIGFERVGSGVSGTFAILNPHSSQPQCVSHFMIDKGLEGSVVDSTSKVPRIKLGNAHIRRRGLSRASQPRAGNGYCIGKERYAGSINESIPDTEVQIVNDSRIGAAMFIEKRYGGKVRGVRDIGLIPSNDSGPSSGAILIELASDALVGTLDIQRHAPGTWRQRFRGQRFIGDEAPSGKTQQIKSKRAEKARKDVQRNIQQIRVGSLWQSQKNDDRKVELNLHGWLLSGCSPWNNAKCKVMKSSLMADISVIFYFRATECHNGCQ